MSDQKDYPGRRDFVENTLEPFKRDFSLEIKELEAGNVSKKSQQTLADFIDFSYPERTLVVAIYLCRTAPGSDYYTAGIECLKELAGRSQESGAPENAAFFENVLTEFLLNENSLLRIIWEGIKSSEKAAMKGSAGILTSEPAKPGYLLN